MSILKNCCCCLTIRRGSFAIGLFTLIFYTIVVAIGAFHVNEGTHSAVLLILSLIIVIFSGLCVAASVCLLVGLSVDCKHMLLPWIIIILITTLMDILYSIIWIIETHSLEKSDIKKEERHAFIVLSIDIIMCAFNIYGIICVISQYQEYNQGRGTIPYTPRNKNLLPPIEFRLIQLQNSKLIPKSSDLNSKNVVNCESIGESDLLKVPKFVETSSGSSAVEDLSDGSLLTDVLTINDDSKNFLLDSAGNKKINKEVTSTIDSNNINNNNCVISSKILKQNIMISI